MNDDAAAWDARRMQGPTQTEALPRASARRNFVLGAAAFASLLACNKSPAEEPNVSESDTLRRQAANLALIQRYARAWQSGDLPALVACYHPEFTLHYFGRSTLAGQHAGLRTALATLQEFSRRTGRKLVAVLEACAGAERAVLVARERFERQDMRAEVERVFVYSIADERLRQCWVYDADPDLVDRFLA